MSSAAASNSTTTATATKTTSSSSSASSSQALALPPLVQHLLKLKLAHEQKMADQLLGTQVFIVEGGDCRNNNNNSRTMKEVLGMINAEITELDSGGGGDGMSTGY